MMAAIAMVFFACSSESGGETAGNKELNDCLAASIPFPKTAEVTNCTDLGDIGTSAQFSYEQTWDDAIAFFSQQYSRNGWELKDEYIERRADNPNSAPSARWRSVKNGDEVVIELFDYRIDESSGSITGVMMYRPAN